jgi:hypothetical protein
MQACVRTDTTLAIGRDLGKGDAMGEARSENFVIHVPRPSRVARAALASEIRRSTRMTIEQRVKAALSMRDRLAGLLPAPAPSPEKEG